MTRFALSILLCSAIAQAQAAKTFATPADALAALLNAARQPGIQGFLDLFGADSKDLFPDDPAPREAFQKAAGQKAGVDPDPDNPQQSTITVGPNDWPFPIPLVAKNGKWQFDVPAGREEIVARRIGNDEIDAIEICYGYVDAQQEYASVDRNGDGVQEYAQKILSTPGQKDGLFWEGSDSLVGGEIAKILHDHVTPGRPKEPFRGYRFKILKSQGPDAPGGAANYVVQSYKDKWMMGGFALLAWPDQYGITGVRSFIVNHEGVVYQKDLGVNTASSAAAITRFNPDATWVMIADVDDEP